MNFLVSTKTEEVLLNISKYIWNLQMPIKNGNSTIYWNDLISHPETAQKAFAMMSESIYLDENLNSDELPNYLVEIGTLNQSQAATLKAFLESNKNKEISVLDYLVEHGIGTVKTEQEMFDEVWFIIPEVP